MRPVSMAALPGRRPKTHPHWLNRFARPPYCVTPGLRPGRTRIGDGPGKQTGAGRRACYSSLTPPVHPNVITWPFGQVSMRSEEHTSELQSRENLVCRLLLEKKKK